MGMLGRTLFALVVLIIAAGLALPLFPSEVVEPDPADVDGIRQVAGLDAFGCPAEDAGGCGPVLSAGGAPETLITITVYFTVEPAAGPPDLPKLPAI
jgi:hypothetical protein